MMKWVLCFYDKFLEEFNGHPLEEITFWTETKTQADEIQTILCRLTRRELEDTDLYESK